jgi:NAD-dependent SIR2 family protein deacetylase
VRVYFLGAGASKSFYPSLPTAGELTLNHLLDSSNYETPPGQAIESLRSLARLQKLGPTSLEIPIESVLDVFEGHDDQLRNLRICLVSRLWVPDTANTGVLVKWLDLVGKSGAILLTTNYDTVLERGISKLTNPIDLRPLRDRGLIDYGVERGLLFSRYKGVACGESQGSIRLLKLHGSISWGYCEVCKKAELDPSYRDLAEDALDGAADCEKCSLLLSPILVGPTKKHYNHPIIESIFGSARRALEQAEEIVFTGFSLSASDERIKELLASSHKIAQTSRVVIVDKSTDGLRGRYRDIYGDALQETAPDWKSYLTKTV